MKDLDMAAELDMLAKAGMPVTDDTGRVAPAELAKTAKGRRTLRGHAGQWRSIVSKIADPDIPGTTPVEVIGEDSFSEDYHVTYCRACAHFRASPEYTAIVGKG